MIFRKHTDHGCYYCGRAPKMYTTTASEDGKTIYAAKCPKDHMMSRWSHSPDEASRAWFDLVDDMNRTRDEVEQ